MIRVVRGMLLLALAILILHLLVTGRMALYMSQAIDPLSAVTAVLLACMGAFELVGGLRSFRSASAAHQASLTDQALTAVVVLLPVGLGLFTSPRALDSSALDARQLTRVLVAYSATAPAAPVRPPAQPVRDVPDLFGYLREAGIGGVGQPVHLQGMVAHSNDLPADEIILLRYRIVHCVADAQPIGLIVVVPDSATTWRRDTWVDIDGRLTSRDGAGARLVSVDASRMSEIDEPPNPYLQTL